MKAEQQIQEILYRLSTDCGFGMVIDFSDIQTVIQLLTEDKIEFAKHHVEQALIEASKTTTWREEPTMQGCKISFVKAKILNSYPLENIK